MASEVEHLSETFEDWESWTANHPDEAEEAVVAVGGLKRKMEALGADRELILRVESFLARSQSTLGKN